MFYFYEMDLPLEIFKYEDGSVSTEADHRKKFRKYLLGYSLHIAETTEIKNVLGYTLAKMHKQVFRLGYRALGEGKELTDQEILKFITDENNRC